MDFCKRYLNSTKSPSVVILVSYLQPVGSRLQAAAWALAIPYRPSCGTSPSSPVAGRPSSTGWRQTPKTELATNTSPRIELNGNSFLLKFLDSDV